MLNHGISSGSRIRIRDAASRAEFENLDVQLEYGRSTGILELYRYRYGRGTGTAAAQQYSGTILNSFCCKFAPKCESDPKKFRNSAVSH